jgi:HSP20 family molecular chaperone IbpA
MSIRDVEKLNSLQMDRLQRKHSRETAHIEEGHDNLKTEVKKENANQLVDIQHENMRQVASENEKKEKVLEQMKQQLDQTRKMTDTQIKELKDNSSKIKQSEHEKLSVERDRVKSEHDLYLEDMGYKFNKEYKKINNESQVQVKDLKEQKVHELSQTEFELQNKIDNQTVSLNDRYQTDSKNYKKIKDTQDTQYKNERMNTNVRQQQELAKVTETHNKTLEVRDDKFRKGIKDQDVVFEAKYVETLKAKNEDLKNLDDLNNKVLSKMKDDLKETLVTSVKKSDDPFYRFTEMKPKLTQFEDRVEITVDVPDHSKEDLLLTINGKEAIINFNRRYDDTRKEAGVTNKLHKVESFSTRLATQHHLDPKSVKSTYENGVMTYKIQKS